MVEEQAFYRDTWAEINLDHIFENIKAMKQLLPEQTELFAVVKANAYGHGDEQVAKMALAAGASYLAVACLDEGLALRKKGIAAPILVIGASRADDVRIAASNQITLTVFQLEWLKKAQNILTNQDQLKIHLKFDTGMGRIGIRTKEELKSIEQYVKEDNRVLVEGVFSHFATADEKNLDYFHEQYKKFIEMVSWLDKRPRYVHCSNSATALRFPEAAFNAIRYGISMYGLTPSLDIQDELPFQLKPAFSLYTRLVHVKKLHKGEKVSYGATYEASEDEWIGTLPIGYADGWIRKLSGQEVLVNGQRAPIVGRVCMDQCMIKLPYEISPGTLVTLIGTDGEEHISIEEIASKLETINYEVACMISYRIPRVYKQDGNVNLVKNYLLS